MTLTAPHPTKAIASVLAALLLSTTLAVAVPTQAELPGVLGAFDVTAAEAHTQQHCYEETVYVTNGGSFPVATTQTVCVNVEHSHWYRSIHMGAALGLSCGALGFAIGGPAGSMALGFTCGAVGGALGAAQ